MDKISILKFANGEYEIKDSELTQQFNQFKNDISEDLEHLEEYVDELPPKILALENYVKKYNTIYVYPYDIINDGSTDVSSELNDILNNLNENEVLNLKNGTYLINDPLILNKNRTGIYGGKLITTDLKDMINITADYCTLENIYIDGGGLGRYGISIKGKYNLVDSLLIENMKYSAIMCEDSYNTVQNTVGKSCGWDLFSNFGEDVSYNTAFNCHAIDMGRHGFSNDFGTHHITYERCKVTNLGNPLLAEGHSPFHFEYSDYGKVVNCFVEYNGQAQVCQTADLGETHAGVFVLGSKGTIVDGLDIIIKEDFTPIVHEGYNDYGFIRLIGAETEIEKLHLKSLNVINKSNIIIKSAVSSGSYEIHDSYFEGKINIRNTSTSGGMKAIYNSVIKNAETFITTIVDYDGLIIKDNVFKNCNVVFQGNLVNSKIEYNKFINTINSIRLSKAFSNKKPKNVEIAHNLFNNVNTTSSVVFRMYDVTDYRQNVAVHDNTFKGNFTRIVEGLDGEQIFKWYNNYKDEVFTTVATSFATGFNIFQDFSSHYQNTRYSKDTPKNRLPSNDEYSPRGAIVFNDTPSASGYAGWVCVASGTPGTWKQFGKIED